MAPSLRDALHGLIGLLMEDLRIAMKRLDAEAKASAPTRTRVAAFHH
jgi:hypothetical protein